MITRHILASAAFLTLGICPLLGKAAPTQDVVYGMEICFQELGVLKQRLTNQDNTLEAMRETIEKSLSSLKPGKGGKWELLDQKFTSLKKSCDILSQEGKDLQNRISLMERKIQQMEKGMLEIKTSIQEALAVLVPEAPVQTYKVKAGDSLDKIAKRHKTNVRALKKLNELESDRLAIGQELKIAS